MIAHASLAIDVSAARVRRENERRYEFARMLAATDDVLGELEQLNLDGEPVLPADVRLRMRSSLDGLPGSCLAAWVDSDQVQDVLDGLYDVQERLFRWRYPLRDPSEGDDLAAVVVPEEALSAS